MKIFRVSILVLLLAACTLSEKKYSTWEVYHGCKENIHYSSLTQIDTSNVSRLQPAWIFNTGDADTAKFSQIQCNPIIIDTVMYVTSPTLRLFALHAGTGRKIWEFNPDSVFRNREFYHFILNNNRGVTYWTDGKADKRIFFVAGSYLHCINATTGQLVKNFGDSGLVDLHNDLGREVQAMFITATSPGIIYKDLYILGSRVDEAAAAAPGHIRAYDVRTGRLRWIFHTIPQPGEVGYETWDDKDAWKNIGGANCWSGFSLDEEKGILFAPTGSASYDFYGGKRTGNNLFANCVIALDANTGKRIWHFQTVHHDVWDRDVPTPPALVTIKKDGRNMEAIAQPTKSGFIFLFERTTGKPVYPIEERPVPVETGLTGEKLSSTQPYPTFPKPFVRQQMTENDLNTLVPDSSYQDIKAKLASYKTGHMFNPPSMQGTVIFPGFDGGAEWGGPAFDPETGILYINANEMPWVLTMVDVKDKPVKAETNFDAGQRLYKKACMTCHGEQMQGSGNNPPLVESEKKYSGEQFIQLVTTGRRMMPANNQLNEAEKKAIASFVLNLTSEQKKKFTGPPEKENPYHRMPYTSTGYNKFLTKEGYPALSPPWGTLNAIDLNTGELVWKNPLGEYPELKAKGIPPTGTENYGGPVVTAGGLLFIAAARDGKFRAYNKLTGKILWEYDLPAPAFATPAVYELNGKQYIVIACGGGKLKTKSGDAYVAFALPEKKRS